MKVQSVPFLWILLVVGSFILLFGTCTVSSANTNRVKRGGHGHGRSFSTAIAYSRVRDSGHGRSEGHGHGGEGHGNRRSPVGEDFTHTTDFKGHGVGYEHQHGGHCEESKCGYNIRHCPHGCVFTSLTCSGTEKGPQYDTCCC